MVREASAVTATDADADAPLARPASLAATDTGYDPAVAEAGTVTCNVPEPCAPGARLIDAPLVIVPAQPEGMVGATSKVDVPQAVLLLLVTDTATLVVPPAATDAEASETAGAVAVQTGAAAWIVSVAAADPPLVGRALSTAVIDTW
jgi:hypothetical protein